MRAVAGAVAVVAAVLLALVETGPLASWEGAAPVLGGVAAGVGGVGTLVGVLGEARHRRREALRAEIDRLVDGYRYALFSKHGLSSFDVGVAVWKPGRRRALVSGHRKPVLSDGLYRSRSRHRYTSTGIRWAVGKGVIGRCLETGDVIAEDLKSLWTPYRGCGREEWESLPFVEVRQRLTYEEFERTQGTGSVIPDGHLTQVVAVPVLSGRGGRALACVAVDVPSGALADIGPEHDVVQGLRGIADTVARAIET